MFACGFGLKPIILAELDKINENINSKLSFSEDNYCSGEIQLSDGINGVFEWECKQDRLKGIYNL